MSRTHAFALAGLIALVLPACGGGGGNGSTSPPPSGGGGTTSTNPCSTALEADQAPTLAGLVAGGESGAVAHKKTVVDGDPRGRVIEALWLHQAGEAQRERDRSKQGAAAAGAAITSPGTVGEDVGELAVVQDQGDLVLPANIFDLTAAGFRFTPSGGGYSVSKITPNFRSNLGTRLILADDDSREVDSQFSFPFYGATQKAAFVNSDGNVTFGEADKASTERDVSRLVSGAPRVAPFLADLDPTTAGKIFANAASDQYTVTWCSVRGFDSQSVVTVQMTLLPDGTIEFKYGDSISLRDAVVGLSPGQTATFTTMDLSQTNPSSGSGALGERFAAASSLDTVAVARKFYASHSDNFEQILLWTDRRLVHDAFSYELTVANEIRGIGQDIYDLSSQFGSGGRLRSMVVMDDLAKFPANPADNVPGLGANTTLSVIGQEVGHRWLAYVDFRDRTGARSDALLGRDLAHWSFFFDSDGSVMEGNDIQDLGAGQFKTGDPVKRYSLLDQYMMGLIPASSVPPFFYVEPLNSNHVREDPPEKDVTFTGTRRDVLVDDIIAINRERDPSSTNSSKTFRQAFIFIVSAGNTASSDQLAKLENFRRQWEVFFRTATDGRMTPNTTLR